MILNWKQKIVLWITAIVIAIITFSPPYWYYDYHYVVEDGVDGDATYDKWLQHQQAGRAGISRELNLVRTGLALLGILALGSVVFLTFSKRPQKRGSSYPTSARYDHQSRRLAA